MSIILRIKAFIYLYFFGKGIKAFVLYILHVYFIFHQLLDNDPNRHLISTWTTIVFVFCKLIIPPCLVELHTHTHIISLYKWKLWLLKIDHGSATFSFFKLLILYLWLANYYYFFMGVVIALISRKLRKAEKEKVWFFCPVFLCFLLYLFQIVLCDSLLKPSGSIIQLLTAFLYFSLPLSLKKICVLCQLYDSKY